MINERIGEERMNNKGQKMKIIEYRNYRDIDVIFEDGSVREHVDYYAFKRGQVATKINRIGEESYNKKGQKMQIVAYRSAKDIDVVFEDGTVREHIAYSHFKEGKVLKNPDKVGEISVNNKGQKMQIVAYRNAKDIDVAFEDGTVREHIAYTHFKEGKVSKAAKKKCDDSKLGDENFSKSGFHMKVTDVYNVQGRRQSLLEVTFEDGVVVRDITSNNFQNGNVVHPEFNGNRRCSYRGYTYITRCFSLDDGRVFYNAISPTGKREVLTPQQMIHPDERMSPEEMQAFAHNIADDLNRARALGEITSED